MQPDERDPTKPGEWLRRSKSNRGAQVGQRIILTSCMKICALMRNKQQKTHSISDLLTLVSRAGIQISAEISEASDLTLYAVESRYPGLLEDVEEAQYLRAVALADRVVLWVERTIETKPDQTPQEPPISK